jgi:hypothetical protein
MFVANPPVDKNIWSEEGWSDWRVEKTAKGGFP